MAVKKYEGMNPEEVSRFLSPTIGKGPKGKLTTGQVITDILEQIKVKAARISHYVQTIINKGP